MPAETSEHEVAHGRVDHGLARLQLVLIVLGQAAKAPQPAEGALHNPAVRLHLEAGGLGLLLGALDDLDPPAELLAQLLHQRAAVGGIGPDEREPQSVDASLLRAAVFLVVTIAPEGEVPSMLVVQEMLTFAQHLDWCS